MDLLCCFIRKEGKNMDVVICVTGFNIGGMEVFFSGFIKYCMSEGHRVFFITKKIDNDIYHKLIDFNDSHFHLVYRSNKDVVWMNDAEAKTERDSVISKLHDLDINNAAVIVGFYTDLLYVMNLFSEKSLRIMMVWPHPLDWTNRLYLYPDRYHYKIRRQGSHFLFQKKLLKEMDDAGANYFTSYAIRNYNEWYYDVDLNKREIEGLPIQIDCGNPFQYHLNKPMNELKVLWVGRFTYFKNDAIEYIFKTLDELSLKYGGIKFVFNIVGKGDSESEKDIRNRVNSTRSERVEINFLGSVQPNNLTSVFSRADIGIAMGVTVKQMAYTGLPAILIDSLSDKYHEEKCCCWVSKIDIGDDGDGMYYKLAGKPLSNRRRLSEILEEVLNSPEILNKMSDECQDYVKRYYMYDRQNKIILDRAFNSEFRNESKMYFRHNAILRILWKIRKKIVRRR